MPIAALLTINDLAIEFRTPDGPVRAVDGVEFDVPAGRTLALVGESGCGKSVTSLAVMGLLARNAAVVGGSMHFDGHELLAVRPEVRRRLRGSRMAMIFQEPMTSLNPLMTVGHQVAECLRLQRGLSAAAARRRVIELFEQVGIRDAAVRFDSYPHQFSGGMRQRVMIAMAIASEPALLIADEPTTALDVTVQAQILALLHELQARTGLAMLFITHDLGVVARIADAVAVMYAGRIVERAATGPLLTSAQHPYTRGLLRSMPRVQPGPRDRAARLPVIPGEVPDPARRPPGCPFHPRCDLGRDESRCRTERPALTSAGVAHDCACWLSSAGAADTRSRSSAAK